MKKYNNILMISFFAVITFGLLIVNNIYYKKSNLNDEYKKDIYIILKMKEGDYWNTIKTGAEIAAKEFNVNLIFKAPDREQDVANQIKLMEESVKEGADAVVIAPSDYEELTSIIEETEKKGIPVIVIDSEVNTNKYRTFIGTNNFEAGKKSAEKLVEIAGENCNVAIVSFVKGAGSGNKRERGFLKEVSKYPNIRVVAKEYGLSNANLSSELTKKILKEVKHVDAVVGLNTISSIGVAKAVDELDLEGKIKVITFDSTQEEVEYIENGIIQATIIQNPFSMGYLGIKYAHDSINKISIPKIVDTGSRIVDINNMYSPENQKIIFSFIE